MTEEIRFALFKIMYRLFHLNNGDIFHPDNYSGREHIDPNNIEWDGIKKTYMALQWAMDNPSYDFKSINDDVRYSNEEIFYF